MEDRIWHQHYDAHVPASLDYPCQAVDDLLKNTARRLPNNTALIFGARAPLLGEQHQKMTFARLNHLADRFAAGLQQGGLQKGERVLLYMPNCPQFVIAYYGILRAGGVAVLCNPLYVAREVEYQLQDSGARLAVVLSLLYENVAEVRANTGLERVIVTNIKEYFPFLLRWLFTLTREKKDGHRLDLATETDTIWWQEFLEQAPATPQPVTIEPKEDTAALVYTGGTTGLPKGAALSHYNVVANATHAAAWVGDLGGPDGEGRLLSALPLSHSYGMTACMNYPVLRGFAQVLIPNPRDLTHLLSTINIHRPTLFPGVPTLFSAINNHPEVEAGQYDLKSIRVCFSGAAPLPLEVQQEFERISGSRLVELYGLSEASPGTIVNPVGSGGRKGTIGVPLPDTDARILDVETETKPQAADQPGVLCVRGPQVMQGYWNRPEETKRVLRPHADGNFWLHTGDIAAMSEDGFFRILDRKKDLILAGGGYNVYPREVEERLYEHPHILEAAVIGVPPNSSDQRIKAFVVLKQGQQLTKEEITDWCREGMARYKVPKYIEFRRSLPKTMVGKIHRRILAEEEA